MRLNIKGEMISKCTVWDHGAFKRPGKILQSFTDCVILQINESSIIFHKSSFLSDKGLSVSIVRNHERLLFVTWISAMLVLHDIAKGCY